MSDRDFMFITWGVGTVMVLLAIPFLPRQEVRTPFRALAASIVLGAIWPLLVFIALVRYAPWWYWAKWVDYRTFLIETKANDLQRDFNDRWDADRQKQYPEAYIRQKRQLDATLTELNQKTNALYSRRRSLESKLHN